MGIFRRKEATHQIIDSEPAVRSMHGVEVASIVDSEEFEVDALNAYPPKKVAFRIVRFVEAYHPTKHIRGRFGNTHSAIVVRSRGKKEYEAFLTIDDRKVVRSFIDKFYE